MLQSDNNLYRWVFMMVLIIIGTICINHHVTRRKRLKSKTISNKLQKNIHDDVSMTKRKL